MPPTPPETASDPSRAAILRATRDLLVREGYHSLTMRKIAERAGCSVGTLYLHVDSKDALLHALLDTAFSQLYDAMTAAADGVDDPEDRLRALIRAYITFGLANPEYYEIMFMLHPKQMAHFPDDLYRRTLRLFDPVEAAIEGCAQREGVPLASPRIAVVALWGAVHGVLSLLLAGRLTRLNLSVDHDQLIDRAVQQALCGLRACLQRKARDSSEPTTLD